jgi:hypothetical protein
MPALTTNKSIKQPTYQEYASEATGWTDPVNGNWGIIDSAFGGTYSPAAFTSASADVTLTTTQCQNVRIKLTGNTATAKTINVFFPATISGIFMIDNATDTGSPFTINIKNAGAGAEYIIATQDANTLVWVDQATAGVYLADSSPVIAGAGIDVVGSTVSLATPVTVARGGTGATSYTSGQLLIGNSSGGLTPATLTAGNSNITIVNGNGSITISAAGGGGASGVTSLAAASSATGFGLSANVSTGAVTITYSISSTSSARTSLGLGTIATQDSSSVAITGGSITGLGTFRVSGQSYDPLSNGAVNVAADSSIYGTNSYLSGSAGALLYWTCQAQQFQLGNAITAATCYFGTTWTNVSDARIKTDVTPYALGTAALKQLRPVNYSYNGAYGSPKPGGAIQTGLIAQEVMDTSLSSMVGTRIYTNPQTGQQTTLYDLNTNQLVFALINAVKELDARVKALEPKVA